MAGKYCCVLNGWQCCQPYHFWCPASTRGPISFRFHKEMKESESQVAQTQNSSASWLAIAEMWRAQNLCGEVNTPRRSW